MRIELSQFYNIDDSLLIYLYGISQGAEFQKLTKIIQEHQVNYIIIDPTESMFSNEYGQSVEETSSERRDFLFALAQRLQDNPRMLYIIINRNDNPAIKTAIPFFVAQGVGDRFIFVANEDEALQIITQARNVT